MLTKITAKIKAREWGEGWPVAVLFAATWLLYATTAAPGTLYGDPSEYQFIPAVWGIVHPPGYAFYTLLAGLWQRIVVVGSVAFRTNLLAGAAGAWAVTRVFLLVRALARESETAVGRWAPWWAATLAAVAFAVSPDLWQHSSHANAHVVSVALTMTQLWLLVRWSETGQSRWLYALATCAGIGVTHHPITIWGLPAYALFIVVTRPALLRSPRELLTFLACGLLGLLPWLYFPLRSPSAPFGPNDMATWAGFLRHATAQGLRVNLFHFGLADQWDRLRVFWTLLRLQYPWPLLALLLVGAGWLARRRPRYALLWGGFLLGHLVFTLNSVQDVMAYLLHAFGAAAMGIGVGGAALLMWVQQWRPRWRAVAPMIAAALALLPLAAGVHTYPRLTLRDWDAADRSTLALVARFEGTGAGAAFVSDWEHLTPFYYHTLVEGLPVAEADLRPVYVTAAQPWPESVFGNLPLGPVYLSNYRRDIRDLGFRLRPVGDLWQVLEPPALEPVAPQHSLDVTVAGRLTLLGYDLPVTTASPGEAIPVVLYARVATTETHILMPYAQFGALEQRWTTDSRRLTPEWRSGEIIAERYELYVPHTLAPGRYPLALSYVDMTTGESALPFEDGRTFLSLGELEVQPSPSAERVSRVLRRALTNIGNDVALMDARVRAGWRMRSAIWEHPLPMRPGQPLHLTLTWRALQRPRASYTVFIHLIDAAGQPWLGHDYTPLGGAFPTYLWFPKWIEGQQVIDPYRLVLPESLPPGQYWLQVGMYEMGSVRRIAQLDWEGNMTGDRYILGPILVEP